MKRRSFFKSCGGAIAALMLPFGVKVKTACIGMDIGDKSISFCDFTSKNGAVEIFTDCRTRDEILVAYIDYYNKSMNRLSKSEVV